MHSIKSFIYHHGHNQKMTSIKVFLLSVFFCEFFLSCKGQKTFGSDELNLKQSIPLPDVKGRIDHLDINQNDQVLFVAALGNNSLEIVDLKNGKLLQSIKGLDEPQGVAFIPQTKEIMVANGGNGECKFYKGATFENTATISLGSDADDVRYDSIDQNLYVGYGNGGIAVIDAVKHKKIADVKLPAHPEGFQLDKEIAKLFVNIPDANQIDVIDLKQLKVVATWKTEYKGNFPMTIDVSNHTIFLGYRKPGKLVAINELTGQTLSTVDLISDIDDLYYDNQTHKIYASGGGGAINIYSFDKKELKQVANIPTPNGARTSLLISDNKKFVLAQRSNGATVAQIKVYNIL
jgi:DNA-binding beta-propeller fold protein YncE